MMLYIPGRHDTFHPLVACAAVEHFALELGGAGPAAGMVLATVPGIKRPLLRQGGSSHDADYGRGNS